MSKFCLITFSLVGSSPALVMAANSSGSLPPSHEPIFFPARSAGVRMFLSLKETIRVPERWRIWAIHTRSVPPSRDWSVFGTHETPRSAPPGRDDLQVVDVRAARQDRDVKAGVLVVALVDRRVVAAELRLRHPLELELDRDQRRGRGARPRLRSRCPRSSTLPRPPRLRSARSPSVRTSSPVLLRCACLPPGPTGAPLRLAGPGSIVPTSRRCPVRHPLSHVRPPAHRRDAMGSRSAPAPAPPRRRRSR